ncbi:MAG TPA: hypothetical protein VNG71_04680 [Pyrinomonadaceae bacterium]|nr:hypothetical protein [Pyrinomonadaceae bacterium]
MRHLKATRVFTIPTLLVAVCVWTATCQHNEKQPDPSRDSSPPANSGEAIKVMTPGNSPSIQSGGNKTNDQTGCATKDLNPSIQITVIPRKGSGPDETERIAGTVSGASEEDCKVVIFAHTDTWYVQPYVVSYDTPIGKDCKWDNDTHLGFEYAALLVKKSFKTTSPIAILPNVGGSVLARTIVPAKN